MSTHNALQGVHFLTSATAAKHFPSDTGAEVAFVGRSNVGKSSTINALCSQQRLAYSSKTPGRTQMINFFQVTADTRLVDLPGYGFAKVPIEIRQAWRVLLEDYLQQRQCLRGLFVLMDCRHPLQANDQQLLAWGQTLALPISILLTKADKLSRGAGLTTLRSVEQQLKKQHFLGSVQLFSSKNKQGVAQVQQQIAAWLWGQTA